MCHNRKGALLLAVMGLALGLCLLAACQRMASEGRLEPLERSDFFDDEQSARPLVSGTVPLASYLPGDTFATGQADGEPVATVPMTVTDQVLLRGRERFNIYCAPCHGGGGTGNGVAVQRGYPPPPSLFEPRLREAPVGHLYIVITHGFGTMPNYDIQIPTADRWAIAAALRAIQDSQPAPAAQP